MVSYNKKIIYTKTDFSDNPYPGSPSIWNAFEEQYTWINDYDSLYSPPLAENGSKKAHTTMLEQGASIFNYIGQSSFDSWVLHNDGNGTHVWTNPDAFWNTVIDEDDPEANDIFYQTMPETTYGNSLYEYGGTPYYQGGRWSFWMKLDVDSGDLDPDYPILSRLVGLKLGYYTSLTLNYLTQGSFGIYAVSGFPTDVASANAMTGTLLHSFSDITIAPYQGPQTHYFEIPWTGTGTYYLMGKAVSFDTKPYPYGSSSTDYKYQIRFDNYVTIVDCLDLSSFLAGN